MQEQKSSTPINHLNNFTTKLCEKLLTFSENGQFSDICIISSDGIKFNSHKCVLSAASDYFMAMFGGSLKESSSTEVKIHEINGKVLQLVLTFLYTGQIQLQSDTMKEILRAATFLQIQPLITECYNSMAENLNAKNCLEIALFADQHELLELYKRALKFASLNFEKICKENDILQLDEHQLAEIISSEELCVSSEEVVYLNLIKWMEHDKLNREQSAIKLLSKIRYWLLSPNFIKEHRSKLPKQMECVEMVCSWLEWHLLPEWQRSKPMAFSKLIKPSLLFVGGGKIQTYDDKLNIWTIESFPNLPTSFMNVVAVKNKLIFGAVGKPILCFDLQTHEVTNLPSRNVKSEFNGMINGRT
ncbi:kelch-like protein 4 [Episyrphus balteatus]|uniref:kelch-like protein 4 n=1 Tax=Episyrphus balteatus TaxID=286459 RepID=UPI0024851460|nr:kelch-like protein 4 [Episyrphus balteatus]